MNKCDVCANLIYRFIVCAERMCSSVVCREAFMCISMPKVIGEHTSNVLSVIM